MKRKIFSVALLVSALSQHFIINPAFAQISNPKISNDGTNIYFSYTENNKFTYNHVFIDSDVNTKTGYSIGGIGADRLLENGGAYKSTANGSNWSWSSLQNVTFQSSNNTYSWTIPLSILGTSSNCNVPIKVVVNYQLTGSGCGSSVITNPAASASNTGFLFSYKVSTPQTDYRVLIDSDQNASTGFVIGGIGADYLLDGVSLYKYAGTGSNWTFVKNITFSQPATNSVSWTIGRQDVGNFDCAGQFNYIYQVITNNVSVNNASATLNFTADPNCKTPPPPPPPPPPSGSAQHIAVPAYFDPCTSSGCNWVMLDNAIPTANIAVINPDSGPGSSSQASYVTQTKTTQGLGGIVIGYVDTQFAARSSSAVTAEIDQYYQWYNVDGIFFDDGANSCNNLSYYQTLNNYVKAKGGKGLTVVNYGTNAPECLAAASDILIEFEDVYSNYSKWKQTGWEGAYPASHFWHIIYDAPQGSLAAAISTSQKQNVGYVYVTSLTLPNPYLNLPASSYWTSEVAAVAASS
jgi:hypothetical protein